MRQCRGLLGRAWTDLAQRVTIHPLGTPRGHGLYSGRVGVRASTAGGRNAKVESRRTPAHPSRREDPVWGPRGRPIRTGLWLYAASRSEPPKN